MMEGIKHRHSLKKDYKRLKRLKMTPNTQLEEQWRGLGESILHRVVQFSNGVLPSVGVSYHSDKIDFGYKVTKFEKDKRSTQTPVS